MVAVPLSFAFVHIPLPKGIGLGGWIPVTKTVEVDGKSGTTSSRETAAATVTDPGANLYPRKAQPSDPNFSYPLFPKDALYSFLKLDVINLVGPVVDDEARSDWVLDTLDNTDLARTVGSVAYGINVVPNLTDGDPTNDLQTGVYDPTSQTPRKRGHWPGLRIVDGIGNSDQTVFGAGGKENNVSSWKIVPGSVGSAKYDITQAYLAESTYRTPDLVNYPDGIKSIMMFGVERRDNGGVTAYDLEINQKPPTNSYIPTRTVGDVLVAVQLPSGVGQPSFFIFVWNGTKYAPFDINTLPAAKKPVISTNLINTPSAPWGFVDSKGVWRVGQIPAGCFAEILIPISPELSLLNNAAGDTTEPLFMQIRTRSSVGDTSDLKDLTTYFPFAFSGPTASMNLRSNCGQGITYFPEWPDTTPTGVPYRWQFGVDAGASMTSLDPGFGPDPEAPGDGSRFAANFTDTSSRTATVVMPAGVPYVDCDVYLTVSPGTTTEAMLFDVIRVYRQLAINPTLTQGSSPHTFVYTANPIGGKAPYTFAWTFYDSDNVVIGTSLSANGSFDAQKSGTYHASLTIMDTGDLDKDVCSVTANSNSITFGGKP